MRSPGTLDQIEKGGYSHYMIKEIMEQPIALQNCMRGWSHLNSSPVKPESQVPKPQNPKPSTGLIELRARFRAFSFSLEVCRPLCPSACSRSSSAHAFSSLSLNGSMDRARNTAPSPGTDGCPPSQLPPPLPPSPPQGECVCRAKLRPLPRAEPRPCQVRAAD